MDEDDEPRDRGWEPEPEWAGAEVGTRLYLVRACRCCLVTVETDPEEGAGASFFSPPHSFGLALSPERPDTHAHRHTLAPSVRLPRSHAQTHTRSNSKVPVLR